MTISPAVVLFWCCPWKRKYVMPEIQGRKCSPQDFQESSRMQVTSTVHFLQESTLAPRGSQLLVLSITSALIRRHNFPIRLTDRH